MVGGAGGFALILSRSGLDVINIKPTYKKRLVINQKTLRLLITIALFVVLLTIFSSLNADFLTGSSIISLLRESAVVGIIAVGMTFVIISGGIDISVGSTLSLTAMVCANLLRYTSTNYIMAILISLAIALLCGIFNGIIITRLQLPDFIVTLATMNIYRGLTKVISHNDLESISNSLIISSNNLNNIILHGSALPCTAVNPLLCSINYGDTRHTKHMPQRDLVEHKITQLNHKINTFGL